MALLDTLKRRQAAFDFVAWLQDKYGVQLDWSYATPGTPLDINKLLDEYFEIDRVHLDKLRRKALEES